MNRKEHLLVCLSEECSEVIQSTSKALRFGLKDGYPDRKTTNEQDIEHEFNDLIAIIEMLKEEGVIINVNEQLIADKRKKVEKYIDEAKWKGQIAA